VDRSFGIDCIAQRQLNSPVGGCQSELGCVIGRDEQSNYRDCFGFPSRSCSTFWPAASTRTFPRIVRVMSPCAAFDLSLCLDEHVNHSSGMTTGHTHDFITATDSPRIPSGMVADNPALTPCRKLAPQAPVRFASGV